MKRQHFVAKVARKFKLTTESNHQFPVAPKLLEKNFSADQSHQKWAGDITYLYTSDGWLYLAVMIDLHSRAVIGWSMGTRMTADLVCDALSMALWRIGFPKDVIVHSDRGSQYWSNSYQAMINNHQLKVEAIQYELLINRPQFAMPSSNILGLITTGREGTVLLVLSAPSNMKNEMSLKRASVLDGADHFCQRAKAQQHPREHNGCSGRPYP